MMIDYIIEHYKGMRPENKPDAIKFDLRIHKILMLNGIWMEFIEYVPTEEKDKIRYQKELQQALGFKVE